MRNLSGRRRRKIRRLHQAKAKLPTPTAKQASGLRKRVTWWAIVGWAASLALFFPIWRRGAAIERAQASGFPPSIQIDQQEVPPLETGPGPTLTPKQKKELLKSNFEKLKKDSADLTALAKSLQQDINASNEHLLSLKVVEKAEKIQKLAKKIKTMARDE